VVLRLVFLCFCVATLGCSAPEKNSTDSNVIGKLVFEELSYSFGTLKHGDVVGYRFKCYNSGKGPVSIHKVDKACGCTDVVYPKKPILPADTCYVEVVFDTNGWHGRQVKRVALMANDSVKVHELLIWAEIVE